MERSRVLGPAAEAEHPSSLEGRIPGTFPAEGASGSVMGAVGGGASRRDDIQCCFGNFYLRIFESFEIVTFENCIEMSTLAADAAAAWPTTTTRWPSSSAAAGRTRSRRQSGMHARKIVK